ncbi:hypothetical protein [Photobacterium chitinilyticum]|uniref:DUF4345 domain-containing protein n=1 Tax=Photobacterium chitinilyticum TaxID=2485123 RepID=A0A444JNE7_9GAMM|nr:hypothetical protein [Photobacterium chitinilyticum]RWX54604.1 hypothetical protein EDI28_16050 [Photobacterium chitinilyticum]
MNNKAFLSMHAAIYGVFALALFFAPALMWPMYGVEVNDQYAYFLSQHNSIFLGGIAAISFLFREIEASELSQKLFLGLMVTNLLGLLITLYACFTGVFVGFGWSDPAFFALLSILSFVQYKKQVLK